jgi:hypothetical protein
MPVPLMKSDGCFERADDEGCRGAIAGISRHAATVPGNGVRVSHGSGHQPCYFAFVDEITPEQAELLVKIVEDGDGTAILVQTDEVAVLHLKGKNQEVNVADFSALVDWGFLEQLSEQEFRVSPVGRAYYDLLKPPPVLG